MSKGWCYMMRYECSVRTEWLPSFCNKFSTCGILWWPPQSFASSSCPLKRWPKQKTQFKDQSLTFMKTRDITIHKSHDSVRTSVFKFGWVCFWVQQLLLYYFYLTIWFWFDSLNCIKQMPYTNEKTSNPTEDINTIKSRRSSTQNIKTLTEGVMINKNFILKKNDTCIITPLVYTIHPWVAPTGTSACSFFEL